MAGPNLVSFQGTANTQNPNTSEITVSAANPLPVVITEGNISLGNVTLGNSTSNIGAVTVTSGNVTVAGGTASGVFSASPSGVGILGYDPINGLYHILITDTAGHLETLAIGDTYVNLSSDGITSVKSTPGIIKAVTVNTKGTVASTVTIKDGATTVAVIDSLNLSGTFNLNAACLANITATLTGTVAPNVTVTYQ